MNCCLLAAGLLHILINTMVIKCDSVNYKEYLVTPKDLGALQALKSFAEQTGCKFVARPTRIYLQVPLRISPKCEQEFENLVRTYNIRYKSNDQEYKLPDQNNFYHYEIKTHKATDLNLLKSLTEYDYYVFQDYPKKRYQLVNLVIHPELNMEFMDKLKRYPTMEYRLVNFKDDFQLGKFDSPKPPDFQNFSEYILIPPNIKSFRFLKYLENTTYCKFKKVSRRLQMMANLRIHPEFKEKFENITKSLNMTYVALDNVYKTPDKYHYCDYSIYPDTSEACKFLKKIGTEAKCLIRNKCRTSNNFTVVTIHSDFKEQFEYILDGFQTKYAVISCLPVKPDYNNYRSYLVKPLDYRSIMGLKKFVRETDAFSMPPNVRKSVIVNIKINPQYMHEFENVLKKLQMHYALIDYKPKEVDCSNYSAYLVKPKDEDAHKALTEFLIKTNCVYWKRSGVDNQIEIMIHRDFKEEFEETAKTRNIDYEYLMEDFEQNKIMNRNTI